MYKVVQLQHNIVYFYFKMLFNMKIYIFKTLRKIFIKTLDIELNNVYNVVQLTVSLFRFGD